MAILPASVNSGLCMPLGYFERVNLALIFRTDRGDGFEHDGNDVRDNE